MQITVSLSPVRLCQFWTVHEILFVLETILHIIVHRREFFTNYCDLRVMATERGTTQDFNNHLVIILIFIKLITREDAKRYMSYTILTDAELRVVISCNITAVRRTDCRINDLVSLPYLTFSSYVKSFQCCFIRITMC